MTLHHLALVVLTFGMCDVISGALDPTVFTQNLEKLVEDELSVSQFQKYIDERVKFTSTPLDGEKIVDVISEALRNNFVTAIEALHNIHAAVEKDYERFTTTRHFPTCCDLSDTEMDHRFRAQVNFDTMCVFGEVLKNNEPKKYATSAVLEVMKANYRKWPTLKYQYFGTEDGVITTYPANKVCLETYDPRFRPWYAEGASQKPKDVVVVIDRSGSMGDYINTQGAKTLMDVAADAANTVLATLNPNDRAGVVSFADDAQTPVGEKHTSDCYANTLAKASPKNKQYLMEYVKSLNARGYTNYEAALKKAFEFFHNTEPDPYDNREREMTMLFLSDGKPTRTTDEKILNVISSENAKLNNSVLILTYGIGGAVNEAVAILTNMAKQSNSDPSAGEVLKGQFTPVEDTKKLRKTMGTYYRYASFDSGDAGIRFSVPYVEISTLGMITSVCLPLLHNRVFFGVCCIDITLSDLLSEVTFFQQGELSYAFVMDAQSRLLMHPLLPRPHEIDADPVFLHMPTLEPGADAEFVRLSMVNREMGNRTFLSRRIKSRGVSRVEGIIEVSLKSTYFWKPVERTVFCVCIVVAEGDRQARIDADYYDKNFMYHRLDLLPSTKDLCTYFTRLTPYTRSVVQFAARAFTNPYKYLDSEETEIDVQSYEAYMTGATDHNRYFKDGIRESVAATAVFDNFVGHAIYTVWNYVATHDGMFRVFPGTIVAKQFDHTLRPWYKRITGNKGRITFTTPYEDSAGAGPVISIGHTLYEASSSGIHKDTDLTFAVLGIDITMHYLESLIGRDFPICKESRVTCFVVDHSGFLVLHPSLLEEDASFEGVHLVTKEPGIAEKLVNARVMKAEGCIDFEHIANYSYWRISLYGGTPIINSEYELHEISKTNILIGIKKKKVPTATLR